MIVESNTGEKRKSSQCGNLYDNRCDKQNLITSDGIECGQESLTIGGLVGIKGIMAGRRMQSAKTREGRPGINSSQARGSMSRHSSIQKKIITGMGSLEIEAPSEQLHENERSDGAKSLDIRASG